MMMKITLIYKIAMACIFIGVFSKIAHAQEGFEFLSSTYRSIPSQGSNTIADFNARLNVPILISSRGILLGGVAYSTRPDNIQDMSRIDLTLSTFSFNLSYIKPLNPSTRMLISMNTGMYSDFRDITAEDFNTSALGLISKSGKIAFHILMALLTSKISMEILFYHSLGFQKLYHLQ